MTYEIAWTHEVGPARPDAFERAYGVDGDWARLFRRGTRLGGFVRR